mgnify:CR=1 FL=1
MTSVKDVEYQIRKLQRGIRVAAKTNKLLKGEPAGPFLANNRAIISRYTEEVIRLKRMLFSMTGQHSPQSPKWPL